MKKLVNGKGRVIKITVHAPGKRFTLYSGRARIVMIMRPQAGYFTPQMFYLKNLNYSGSLENVELFVESEHGLLKIFNGTSVMKV